MITGAVNGQNINLSFATQNCNSLNMTTNVKNFELKIAAIKNLGTDIIFLCDTRMVSNKGVNGINRVKQAFRDTKGKKYKVYANSTKNSRGVAILISFDINMQVIEICSDIEENYIFLKVMYMGQEVILGSIYGPNNTSRDFYRCLTRILNKNRNSQIIMGGDWNTVWDRNPVATNIDTFNMASIPNAKNSELLEGLASEFGLFDPYRVLYPSKRSFTYSPYGTVRLNRSRLDFFVVSANVLNNITKCACELATTIKLYDHKSVSLVLGYPTPIKKPPPKLRNSNLKHPLVVHHVRIAELQCHTVSLLAQYSNIKRDMMAKINSAKNLLAELGALYKSEARNGHGFGADHAIQAKITELEILYDTMPVFEAIMQLEKDCSSSRFFEVLTEQTRNAGIKAQKKLALIHKIRTSFLECKIENLKQNFDENYVSIFESEHKLALLRDGEVRDKLMDLKIFEILNAERASPHFLNIAKKTADDASLDSIRNSQGEAMSKEELNFYLTNFYQSLYRSDPAVEGEIEDFLGEDILQHPMVRGSMLTEQETFNLDRNLEINELDKALEEANMKSAPGVDGFSYRFIKEFWHTYRIP